MKRYLVILNSDKRLIHLINKLSEQHEVIIVDNQQSFENAIKDAKYTHLLLPITGVDNTLTIRGCNIRFTEDLINQVSGKTILTGLLIKELEQICQAKGILVKSYLGEDFAIENNYITCEGVIEKLVNLSEKSIYKSSIMIVGYGRLGQILAKVLEPFKTNLYIVARSDKDLTSAKIDGYHPVPLESLSSAFHQVDFVVNTVPVEVINHDMLDQLIDLDVLILDISSAPYGLDHEHASSLNLQTHILPKIPGKIAPKSSGELMAKYISLL